MRIILSIIFTLFAGAVTAQETRYILGLGYGVEIYMNGNSCRPDAIFMDVDAPLIAVAFERENRWHEVLRRPMERLNEVCGADPYRTLRTNLIVQSQGETILTARMISGDAAGYSGSGDTYRFDNYLIVENTNYAVDTSSLARSGRPSELYWNGELSLKPKMITMLQELDTGEDYFALAFKYCCPSKINQAGRSIRLPPTTSFPTSFGNTIERLEEIYSTPERAGYYDASLKLGYPLALSLYANAIFPKMLTRTSNGIGYDPTLLTDDERDEILLATAKMLVQNYIEGSRFSQNLTELGFDVERAVQVVQTVGLDATTEHLRAAPTTDRSPTRFEMGRAFGPALVENRCNGITAFLNSGAIVGSAGGIRQAGDACIISDARTTAFGYRLVLKLDRIYNPDCQGGEGEYSCSFQYNLDCRVEGEGTQGMFGAAFCLPFQTARQPAVATFRRLENGGWETTRFELAQP